MSNAPVVYIPSFLGNHDADAMFAELMDLPWTRREFVPRDEIYFNDIPAPYSYGTPPYDRTYLPEPDWHPVVRTIRFELEKTLDTIMDVCFLNRYLSPRDQLGWHADDSPEMDPLRPIVTISLGGERDIQFRRVQLYQARPDGITIERRSVTETLRLRHGSCAIMQPGMQQTWQHRIPKVGHEVGPRISLTFRGYKP